MNCVLPAGEDGDITDETPVDYGIEALTAVQDGTNNRAPASTAVAVSEWG